MDTTDILIFLAVLLLGAILNLILREFLRKH